ncbi:hypothetical protein FDP25_03665 [Roseovarius sp. A21]|uniref:Uncharacterized protein n=2 Tax=Roseovarius bejariae TaxID=2576383 RepID=A0A844CWP0_9RHOB|nr:hypothetical protein [Roseovarius bejariae]
MKGKLSNVSFGGNWSEDLFTSDQLYSVLDFLDLAATECADREVRGKDMEAALSYVEEHIEKGTMLTTALRQALAQPEAWMRRDSALRIVAQIRKMVGG